MTRQAFGKTKDGTEVHEFQLALPSGLRASVLDYGSILRDLVVPTVGGAPRRVVLGFRDLDGYLADAMYLGANAGRCGNRIADGKFTLDGKSYQLTLNEKGTTHLHGGKIGFSRRLWSTVAHDDSSVTLALTSPAGEEGYPGRVEARCIYRLLAPATLRIELSATSDAPTLVNIAHHSYFNLDYGKTIRAHLLQIQASKYTPSDSRLIPTGAILDVAGTPYDFRRARAMIHPSGDTNFMLDMNFALDRKGPGLMHAATVSAPGAPLRMEVHTTEPGLQLYDATGLGPAAPGLDGKPHFKHGGFCLEPQRFPDSPNHPGFPSAVLRPGETYQQITEYRFPAA